MSDTIHRFVTGYGAQGYTMLERSSGGEAVIGRILNELGLWTFSADALGVLVGCLGRPDTDGVLFAARQRVVWPIGGGRSHVERVVAAAKWSSATPIPVEDLLARSRFELPQEPESPVDAAAEPSPTDAPIPEREPASATVSVEPAFPESQPETNLPIEAPGSPSQVPANSARPAGTSEEIVRTAAVESTPIPGTVVAHKDNLPAKQDGKGRPLQAPFMVAGDDEAFARLVCGGVAERASSHDTETDLREALRLRALIPEALRTSVALAVGLAPSSAPVRKPAIVIGRNRGRPGPALDATGRLFQRWWLGRQRDFDAQEAPAAAAVILAGEDKPLDARGRLCLAAADVFVDQALQGQRLPEDLAAVAWNCAAAPEFLHRLRQRLLSLGDDQARQATQYLAVWWSRGMGGSTARGGLSVLGAALAEMDWGEWCHLSPRQEAILPWFRHAVPAQDSPAALLEGYLGGALSVLAESPLVHGEELRQALSRRSEARNLFENVSHSLRRLTQGSDVGTLGWQLSHLALSSQAEAGWDCTASPKVGVGGTSLSAETLAATLEDLLARARANRSFLTDAIPTAASRLLGAAGGEKRRET